MEREDIKDLPCPISWLSPQEHDATCLHSPALPTWTGTPPKRGNKKKELKPSDAFCDWLVTVKATFEHVDDNTFLAIIVTTVSQ